MTTSNEPAVRNDEGAPPADLTSEQKMLWKTLQAQQSADKVRLEQARCQTEGAKARTEDAKAHFLAEQTRARIVEQVLNRNEP